MTLGGENSSNEDLLIDYHPKKDDNSKVAESRALCE